MKKLLLALFVIGLAGAFVNRMSEREGQAKPVVAEKTAEQLKAEAEAFKVDVARITCRTLVKDAAKYRDTVEFKGIDTFKTNKGGVLVKLDWTGDNKLGMPVRYQSSCNVLDNEVILFTVDDKVLIQKNT